MDFTIRLLHTIHNKAIALQYHDNYVKILNDLGVDLVDSIQGSWWEKSSDYMVIVEDFYTHELIAGIRFIIADENVTLPIEKALTHHYADITRRIHKFDYRIAEICSLWVKKEFREQHFATSLMVSLMSVTPTLKVEILVGLVNKYSLNLILDLGFTVARTIGDNQGQFYYPNENYLSTVVEVNTNTLDTVSEDMKSQILNLRIIPKQVITKIHNDCLTTLIYNLVI